MARNMICRYGVVVVCTVFEVPIKRSTSPVKMKPAVAATQELARRKKSSWPADLLAFSGNPAPVYCDTRDIPAVPNPALNEMKRNIMGHEIDGAATASGPSFPSQNASVRL